MVIGAKPSIATMDLGRPSVAESIDAPGGRCKVASSKDASVSSPPFEPPLLTADAGEVGFRAESGRIWPEFELA